MKGQRVNEGNVGNGGNTEGAFITVRMLILRRLCCSEIRRFGGER
jgi:hypothetical protein